MDFVFLIYGKPACGKYTIAKELSNIVDGYLLDNHFFNNIVFPYVTINNETLPYICESIYKIEDEFLNIVSKYKKENKSYIFTNVLLDNDSDKTFLEKIKMFSQKMNCRFVPIEVICTEECIEKRIDTEDRKNRHKLTNMKDWKNFVDNVAFLDIKNHYEVNTSYKTIEETIEDIKKILYVEMQKST